MQKTVLALVPHPDDAEYHAGGLLVQMIRGGAKVIIVTATDGRKGSYEFSEDALIEIRKEEAVKAAKVLGAEPPIFLGYPDFGLDQLAKGKLRGDFIRLIRLYHPDVVVSEDPYGFYEPHPDHREVAWAASDAVQFASLPLIHSEHLMEGLKPHFVPEKYLYAENYSAANKFVDISDVIDLKISALAQHHSQIVFLVEGLFRQAQLAGINLQSLFGEITADPLAAFTFGIKSQAAEVGKLAGYSFAEAYRYVGYHPLVETLLESRENPG